MNALHKKRNTPLHAVMNGTIARRMDEHGSLEPIHGRVEKARDEIIQILLDAGASEDQINKAGETPKQVLNSVLERHARQVATMQSGRGRGRGRGIR